MAKYQIKSKSKKGLEYEVRIDTFNGSSQYSCTCPDFMYRNNKCKHIRESMKIREKEIKMEEQPVDINNVIEDGNKKLKTDAILEVESVIGDSPMPVTTFKEKVHPLTLEDEYRQAKVLVQSGLLPKSFKTPQQVMTAYRFANEMGFQPLTAMRQMAVINGTPSFYGDLPLSAVSNSGKLESIEEYLIDVEYNKICIENKNLKSEPWAAVCIVKRKDDPVPLERFFTLDDAKTANLFKNAVWKQYTSRMLTYRARSQALKDKFPDCLNGVNIAEYDNHATVIDGNVIEDTTGQDKVKDLNDRFS